MAIVLGDSRKLMTKESYDTDEDGVVDGARSVTVSKIAGAAITQYDVVAFDSDGHVVPAKADSANTMPAKAIAQAAAVEGVTLEIASVGESEVRCDADMTVDGAVYVSATEAGKVTQTAPSTAQTYTQAVGTATGTSTIIISISRPAWRAV